MQNTLDIATRLKSLQHQMGDFITFYRQPIDFDKKVYTYWSAKDVLGHITFWHESFARNLNDLAQGKKPNPLKGKLSEVNDLSVNSTKENTIVELLNRLKAAQKIINNHILNDSILEIPYKKGSRNYTRLEHLDIVEKHISKHLKDLRTIYKKSP
ncbi:MAG: hypothetical protein AB7O47_01820 [Flavobacteriales bacterium]